MDSQNRANIQYNIYQREADTNRQLYDALLQRYKEIGVAGSVGVNNIAIVELSGTTAGTVEQEVQGMTMNMTMDSKFKGEIKVNTQNGTVLESKNNADLNNSMDMMGQQMQISSKANTVTTFTSKS